MKTPRNTKIMLRACPRCHGDLFPDKYEEDMACLQCGRRFGEAALAELTTTVEAEAPKELVKAA
jgi:uncharacterized protein (DUF983 family)